MLLSTSTIQEALKLFTSTNNDELEVYDKAGESIGVFTLDDLNQAIQQGRLNDPVSKFISSLYLNKENGYSQLIHHELFSDIIDSLHDGVYITDGNGVTVKVNRAYERITGLSSDLLVGHHMEEVVKAGYISKSVSIQVIKEKRPITMMQVLHNGRNVIVSGIPIHDAEGNILYVINSVRDITELLRLKLKIDELEQTEKQRQQTQVIPTSLHGQNYIIGDQETMAIYALAERVAKTDAKVILYGESGVGKTVIAKYIHEKSQRSKGPFLELNCGALPASLIEAELFGYEPGAFTGALTKGKKGLLEMADQGTLFLDEIGDMPPELQVKLLKVIEDQAFIPIGSSTVKTINTRIISASNKHLKTLIEDGKFREDLYYRLNVVPITIPPLRERRKDLIPLIQHFLKFYNSHYDCQKEISIEALDFLCQYSWPGNIRELKNIIERLVVTTIEPVIGADDLPDEIKQISSTPLLSVDTIMPLKQAVELVERHLILRALNMYKTTRKAAEALEVSQSTIVQKMKKWRIHD